MKFIDRIKIILQDIRIKGSAKAIAEECIAQNGEDLQKAVLVEEMAELIKEIIKDLRGIPSKKNIAEEIADVEIMLSQAKMMYGIDEEWLNAIKAEKLQRQAERLGFPYIIP